MDSALQVGHTMLNVKLQRLLFTALSCKGQTSHFCNSPISQKIGNVEGSTSTKGVQGDFASVDASHFIQRPTLNRGSASGGQSFELNVADKWKKFLDSPVDEESVVEHPSDRQLTEKSQTFNSNYDPMKKLLDAAEQMNIDDKNRPVVQKSTSLQKPVLRPYLSGANSVPIQQKRY